MSAASSVRSLTRFLCALALPWVASLSCAGPDRVAVRTGEEVDADDPGTGGSSARNGGAGGTMPGGRGGGGGTTGGGGAGTMDGPRPGGAGGAGGAGVSMDGPRPAMGGAGGVSATGGAGGMVATGGAGGRGGAGGAGGMGGSAIPDMAQPRDMPAGYAPGSKKALLVIGDPAMVSPGEMKLKQRLEAKMFTVTLGDDGDPMADGRGMGMVVIASSVGSGMIGARFRDAPIPVINMETFLFKDLKMADAVATEYGEDSGTQITITRAGHMMAAALTGTVAATSATSQLTWMRPGPAAEIVATVANQPMHPAIVGYPAGAMMVGLVAPARRVAFFASVTALSRLTPDGEKLLDAAIDWASR